MYTKYIFGLILLLMVAFVYEPISVLNFSGPDDNWMLLGNEFIEMDHFFSVENVFKIFSTIDRGQYSPVNTIYYRAIYEINGFDPYYFHLFSWLIHVSNVIAVFFLSKKILTLFDIKPGYLPFMICLIWGVHPFNVESVVWISASKVLLFSLFLILSIIFLIDALQSKKAGYLVLSAVFFLMSCFIKEQAFMNTVIIASLMAFYNSKHGKLFHRADNLIFLLVIVCVSITFGCVSVYANSGHSKQLLVGAYSISERLILCFYCLFFYVKGLLIPTGLHFHYVFPFSPNTALWTDLLKYIVFFLALVALTVRLLKRTDYSYLYLFCIGAFVVHIILVLQIIPMTRSAVVADRYMYLPSIFLLIAIAHFCMREFSLTSGRTRLLIQCSLTIYLSYLIFYSHELVNNWVPLNIKI